MGAVEKRYYGIASGAVATMRVIGQMVSMATATVVFDIFLGSARIAPANYDLFLSSLRILFVIFTVACIVGIFFSFVRGHLRTDG